MKPTALSLGALWALPALASYAAPTFTAFSSQPRVIAPAALAGIEKNYPGGKPEGANSLAYSGKLIRLAVESGPPSDMFTFTSGGRRNPTLVVPRSSTLKILFVNRDDDMLHDLRFGSWNPAAPGAGEPSEKDSVGTDQLPPEGEQGLSTQEITLQVPSVPGHYTYFCTVKGHAQDGMWGKIEVR